MAGLTNQIANAIGAQYAAIAGMSGVSARPVDKIPATPFTVVGGPAGRIDQPGSWERTYWTVPVRVFVARVSADDLTQADVSDMLDLILVALRAGITLGALVSQSVITTFDTDRFYTIGGEDYQAIDLVHTVELERSATYTA